MKHKPDNTAESHGVLVYSKGFVEFAARGDPGSSVGYFLLFHALELQLKAFLMAKGLDAEELRTKYGHNLDKLFAKSEELGIAKVLGDVATAYADAVAWTHPLHQSNVFKYYEGMRMIQILEDPKQFYNAIAGGYNQLKYACFPKDMQKGFGFGEDIQLLPLPAEPEKKDWGDLPSPHYHAKEWNEKPKNSS